MSALRNAWRVVWLLSSFFTPLSFPLAQLQYLLQLMKPDTFLLTKSYALTALLGPSARAEKVPMMCSRAPPLVGGGAVLASKDAYLESSF